MASGNEGKAREFREILEPLGFTLKLQSEFNVTGIEETGKSFLENALQKARSVAAQTGLPTIADDSGLCVDYLNGAPGIYSARFSGVHGDEQGCNDKLLKLLENAKSTERTARYWCAVCLVRNADDPVPLTAQAAWEGTIGYKPLGTNGFGYDPLFVVEGRRMTAAQLPPQTKNLLSHRGKALRRLVDEIKQAKL